MIKFIYKLNLISTASYRAYLIQSTLKVANMSDFAPLQLIDGKKQFNSENLETTISTLGHCGKNYYTVAIVGAQNSGKSTLLNNLFGTNFKMLNGIAGHRTTRGVVLGRDKSSNLIILDVEGNDSYESHLEGDDNYERMVGSFALVGANILLVNVFQKQLGQRKGSQYETLSTVMRICIDQFKQESPKTILFVLRDSTTEEAGRGEVKRKIQQDVEKVWKNVWSGTKITPEMQKYQSNPERFFTLEVAFLRQFDPDYPEQFQEDVGKLRQKFIDPEAEGYLFKRQNHQHNLPIEDVTKLLNKIWLLLTTNKELNLPNQKVQLANYRCEQVITDIRNKFDSDIDSKADTIRNYGAILDQICTEFRKATVGYAKAVTEKWQQQLLQGFRPKIRTVVQTVVQHYEKQFTDQFVKQIDELFYDPKQSFKTQSLDLQKKITEKQLHIFKQINFDIPKRKERIESLSSRLEQLSRIQVKNKLEWTQQQFQSEGQRVMKLVAATTLKQYFGMEFWSHLGSLFAERKKQLFEELQSRMLWARGSGTTGADLDSAEQRLMEWLKHQVKIEFERGLPEKLFNYFKNHFQTDQHGMRYDYNLLSEETVMERFTQAKEMTLDLLKRLNNFTLSLSRYTSFIDVEDDVDNPTYNPFLEAGTVLSIREGLERRASQEYSSVMRRKNEARMKKTPFYLIALIAFFVYDDLWFSQEESPFMHYLLTITIVLILVPFALGQGLILQQAVNIIADKIGSVGSTIWSKTRRSNHEQSNSASEEKVVTQNKDKTT